MAKADLLADVKLSEDKINESLVQINTLFLRTRMKAKQYVEAVCNLGEYCLEFDSLMTKHGGYVINGKTSKRDWLESKKDVIGFGNNQFAKYSQIAKAFVIELQADGSNKKVYDVMKLIVADSHNIELKTDDGKTIEVPATVDNLQRAVKKPTKDSDGRKGKSAHEKVLELIDALDALNKTPEQTEKLEKYEYEYTTAVQTVEDLTPKLEDAKAEAKSAKEALSGLKTRIKLHHGHVKKGNVALDKKAVDSKIKAVTDAAKKKADALRKKKKSITTKTASPVRRKKATA